jgi:hypothetical protein
MKPADKIKELITKSDVRTTSETDKRILGGALKHLEKLKQKKSATNQPNLWRIIMKTRITKLTAAAAIAIIVLGGITFWPDSGPKNGKWWLGPPAAWGQEILAQLDTIKGVTCREQTIWIEPDGSRRTSITWNILYVSHDSYRRDIYDGDRLREIQWYVPDGDGTLQHSIRYDLKSYFAHTGEGSFGDYEPIERIRFFVGLLDQADMLLGEKVIEGRNCVGFEISASKYGDNPQEWLDRIWFDIDTKLPVLIEKDRPCPRDKTQTDYHPSIRVQDQFDYNPDLPADTFTPETPEGFIYAHPDEIQAAREKERKQSGDSVQAVQDPDRDGLENRLEAELGTNPRSSDTDSDGLSDYDEYCKYRTDPTKKDSDDDGKPDGDWDERREYAYSIRAICEIRPPSRIEMINDLYQDARPFKKEAMLKDARVVEVLIFPFAEAHVYSQPYPNENLDKKLKEYIQPTVSMNYSSEMKEQIDHIVEGSASDVAAIEKMLQWLNHETRLVRELPHWEYFHVIDGKIVWHKSIGSPPRNEQFLETNFLGDSMFKNKVHGTCSSTAILRGTMFRAAGLPTRLIQTLPLMTRYSEDPEPLADRLRMREMAKGYVWGPGNGGANHTYNEVFLNNRWVRVDNSIGTGPFVGDKLFVKAWSSADWNNLKEEWNDKRCFRALDVSDAHPKYKDKSAGTVDIAVEDKDLIIKENPNGSFDTVILIHNKGSMPSPQFRVNFYAGDPDEGGRLLSKHNSGPIMPRGTWGERDPGLILKPDEDTITVVIDPYNKVAESNETNNKVSRVIPGKQSKTSGISVDLVVEDNGLIIEENPNGSFHTIIYIHNRGSAPSPQFRVNFYAGDPDEGGRLLSEHNSGPIMPGGVWGEGHPGLILRPGENTIAVVIDPDNKVEESNETNNKVSKVIPEI